MHRIQDKCVLPKRLCMWQSLRLILRLLSKYLLQKKKEREQTKS